MCCRPVSKQRIAFACPGIQCACASIYLRLFGLQDASNYGLSAWLEQAAPSFRCSRQAGWHCESDNAHHVSVCEVLFAILSLQYVGTQALSQCSCNVEAFAWSASICSIVISLNMLLMLHVYTCFTAVSLYIQLWLQLCLL